MEIINDLSVAKFTELHNRYSKIHTLGRILAMVEETECQSVIIEKSPKESEFKKEYDHFYKNVFAENGGDTVERLHFFEGKIRSVDEVKDKDSRYLGFCDIRPLRHPSISCALIDKRAFIKKNTKFLFLVCKRKFEVLFNGKKLSVEAFPFIQQDGKIVRCAQAALTSMSMFWNKPQEGPDFTQIAAKIPTRTGQRQIPSQGMNGQQIGISLEKLGYDPVIYDYDYIKEKPLQPREQIIYRYLESGIPVVLGIVTGQEKHALVVVGHTFTPDSWMAQTKTIYYKQLKTGGDYHCCTNWIERFIVQDDNLGPYTLVHSDFLNAACTLIAVGLPKGIYCMAEDAETIARDILRQNLYGFMEVFVRCVDKEKKSMNKETLFWFEEFMKHANNNELVLRTYLRKSNEWKNSQKDVESYPEYKDLLNKLPMPEMVWVVEVSWPHIFRHSRRLCGEIIIDTTDQLDRNISIFKQTWLWMHFPGVIFWRNAKSSDTEVSVIKTKDTIRTHRFTCE